MTQINFSQAWVETLKDTNPDFDLLRSNYLENNRDIDKLESFYKELHTEAHKPLVELAYKSYIKLEKDLNCKIKMNKHTEKIINKSKFSCVRYKDMLRHLEKDRAIVKTLCFETAILGGKMKAILNQIEKGNIHVSTY